jgi:hypothetical protein
MLGAQSWLSAFVADIVNVQWLLLDCCEGDGYAQYCSTAAFLAAVNLQHFWSAELCFSWLFNVKKFETPILSRFP